MKLIKIMDNFDTPLRDRIFGSYTKDLKALLSSDYVLVSDYKYEGLMKNHVNMYLYSSFIDSCSLGITTLNQHDFYIVNVVAPSEYEESFDVTQYKIGDYIFFYKEPPKEPVKPIMGKITAETTEAERAKIVEEYEAAMEEYEAAMEEYEAAMETYKEEEINPSISGCVAVVLPSDKIKIIATLKQYETTKDSDQFTIFGRIPKEMPSLAGADVGSITEGTSIKTMPLESIIVKILSAASNKAKITKPVASATKVDNTSTPVTITATITAPESVTVSRVALVDNDGEETPVSGTSGEITGTVTPKKTNSYKFVAYDEEDNIIGSSTAVKITVAVSAPVVTLSASATTVYDKTTEVTLTATVTGGSGTYTKVVINGEEVTSEPYEVTVIPTATTTYTATAYDENGTISNTASVKVTVDIAAPTIKLTATPSTVTDKSTEVTLTATVTGGSGTYTKVVINGEEFTAEPYTTTVIPTATTTYTATVEDANGTTATGTAKVTANLPVPTVTVALTADKTKVTSSSEEVTLTAKLTVKNTTVSTVGLYKGTELIEEKPYDDADVTFVVSGITANTTYKAKATYEEGTKESSGVTVEYEAPKAKMYWGNYAAVQSQYERPEEDGNISIDELTVDTVKEYMTLNNPSYLQALSSDPQITSSGDVTIGRTNVFVEPFGNLLEQQLVMIPTTVPKANIDFKNDLGSFTSTYQYKTMTIDDIEYHLFLADGLLYDESKRFPVYLDITA